MPEMESGVIVLTHSCRELFKIIDVTESLSEAVGMPMGETTMNV